MMQLVNVTELAKNKIVELLKAEGDPNLRVRLFIQGGGCSGYQYGFTFDDQGVDEDDHEIDLGDGAVLLLDSISSQYVEGATVGWKEDAMGANFDIKNPNAVTTCGCGQSFSA
jgi:iron-sulfur cluster insertion protein